MIVVKTHHDEGRGGSDEAVQEQTSGSTENTVEDAGVRQLLLLFLVHKAFHKQLEREISLL